MCERHGRNEVWGVNGKAGQAGIAVWLGRSTLWLLQSLQLWVERQVTPGCCLELRSPACVALAGRAGGISVSCQVALLAATLHCLHSDMSCTDWSLQPGRLIPSPHCPTKRAPRCLQGVKISWKRFHFFQMIFIRYQSSYSLTHYLPEDLTLQLCLGWELWNREFLLVGWYRTW